MRAHRPGQLSGTFHARGGHESGSKRSGMRSAFSIIELVVTLAIVGVIAAIALPRFSSASVNYRAEGAARRLAAEINSAREEARARAEAVRVSALGASSVRIGLTDGTILRTLDLGAAPFSGSVQSSFAAGAPLEFDAYGVPSAEGWFLVGAGDVRRPVNIDAAGCVSVGEVRIVRASGGVAESEEISGGGSVSLSESSRSSSR